MTLKLRLLLRLIALMTCVWSAVGAAYCLLIIAVFNEGGPRFIYSVAFLGALLIPSVGLGYAILRQNTYRLWQGAGVLMIIVAWISFWKML